MNKETRTRLGQLHDRLKAIVSELTEIAAAEQAKFDNAPENLQDSERVQMWQDCAYFITWICNRLEDAANELENNIICVY